MRHSQETILRSRGGSPLIHVENFHKAYEGNVAVSGLSFDVAAGEILALVGPNGAGKTTTLKALSAVIPASHGQLRVHGYDVDRDAVEVKRRLAYVPDDPELFPDLTVEEHLAFTASAYDVSDADGKVAELLELFELTERRNSTARDLSRGQRQKLALCCAYLHDPTALLFDEPFTGLDPHGIRTLKTSIRSRAAQGAAVIVSSHLLSLIEDICGRVLMIHRGRAQFSGSLAELKQRFRRSQPAATLEEIFFLATEACLPSGLGSAASIP